MGITKSTCSFYRSHRGRPCELDGSLEFNSCNNQKSPEGTSASSLVSRRRARHGQGEINLSVKHWETVSMTCRARHANPIRFLVLFPLKEIEPKRPGFYHVNAELYTKPQEWSPGLSPPRRFDSTSRKHTALHTCIQFCYIFHQDDDLDISFFLNTSNYVSVVVSRWIYGKRSTCTCRSVTRKLRLHLSPPHKHHHHLGESKEPLLRQTNVLFFLVV